LELRGDGLCRGRKTGGPGDKPSEQGENQQQTQPTYAPGRNQTRAALVGDERFYHCGNPAPLHEAKIVPKMLKQM